MSSVRNYSAVMSVKTAASSENHFYSMPKIALPSYSTAVIGGGGPNIYERLLQDSTDNLLRPTAHMIGTANRVSTSFVRHSTKLGVKNFPSTNRGVR